MTEKCLQLIDENATVCIGSEEFQKLDLLAVGLIIERDTLHIAETDLFAAVQK